ncbi:MAG: DUF5711 family protein [Lachnospiraceae bacterium]|jgi:hypothetical protein
MAVIDFSRYRNQKSGNANGRDDGYYDDDDTDSRGGGYYDDDDRPIEKPKEKPKEKTARHARKPRVLEIVILVGAVALLVAAILLQSKTRTFSGADYTKITDLTSVETANADSSESSDLTQQYFGTQYLALGSNIVSYSADGISCMDQGGNMLWNQTFEMQQPLVAISGSVLAIADYNGSTVYIFNSTSMLGSVSTDLPIRGLAVSESGETAVILNDTDNTWFYLYNVSGETISYGKMSIDKTGYPISLAISPNGEMVAISHLTMGTGNVETQIAFYNFGAVGKSYTDNMVSGTNFDDEVFAYMAFFDDDTSVAVSDKRIAFFDGSEIPQNTNTAMVQEEIKGVYSNSSYIAILVPDTTGANEYLLRVYDRAGNVVGEIPFSLEYTAIQLCGDRVVINNDDTLLVYNVDGTARYSGNFDSTVRAVIPQESSMSRYIIVTDSEVELMTLQ